MRISFIIASLRAGGAERALITLANELCKEHIVEIICFHDDKSFYKKDEKIKIIKLEEFEYKGYISKIALKIKALKQLRKSIHTNKADVFISLLDTTNIACLIAKPKRPLIICEHSSHIYLKSKFYRLLRRLFYPKAAALVVLTQKDRFYYSSFVKRLSVLPNPCDFASKRQVYKDKKQLILFVGRLDENKNPMMFLKALSLLKCEYEAMMIGDGELYPSLLAYAKSKDLKLCFKKGVKDIKRYYKRAKILCLCSKIEGQPSVLIEAACFGVARICTPYELGFDELLVDKKDAIIVRDEEQMSLAIARLLASEDERALLAKNALARLSDFEPKSVAKRWLELILKALKA